jgi:gliding motility-associated-like protein
LIASVYTLTVSDFNGCTGIQSATVNNINGAQVILDSIGQVTCPGGNDGFIAVSVTQGSAPFTYQWSNGSTSALAASLPAGIYTLTVTDVNNCPSLFTDTVTAPDAFLVTAIINPASCNLSNGLISLSSTGGTSPYTYLWSTGAASSVVSGLAAGSYSVTLTDNAGCAFDTSFSLVNTGIPAISVVAIDSVSCFGLSDGSINLSVSGGVSPYSYTWVNTSQITEDVFNLPAGSYSVIVIDASGCTATQLFAVGQPAEINVSFTQIINAACGQSNGAVTATASGGVPGFSFQWSTGANSVGISGIPAGSYTVTVTDSKGCTKSAIGNISNLTGPQITAVDSSNISCPGGNNGSILITATGVSLPLSYSWAGLSDTTASLSNLSAGSYTVTVSDGAGCIAVRTVTLTQPAPFVINAVIPQSNPPYNLSCNGASDGTIFLSVTGGTAPYQFVWNNGAITQNIQNLPAGPYAVFITDSRNCTANNSFTVTEPPLVTASAGSNFIVCADSVATLAAAAPTYGTGYWQVLSSNGVITFADSTSPVSFISGLALGENILVWTVTDGSCNDQDQLVITVTTEVDAIVGADRSVCGPTVNLNATRPEFGFGIWTSLNTSAVIEDSTRANTSASDLAFGVNLFLWRVVNGGCRDSAVLTIIRRDSIDCLSKIELPTAFSPNDDGFNDFLLIKGLEEYPDNEIMIFNRWGQVVFRRNSYRNDWRGIGEDGNPVVDGTYFVVLKVGFLNRVFNTYLDLRR